MIESLSVVYQEAPSYEKFRSLKNSGLYLFEPLKQWFAFSHFEYENYWL